MKRDGVPTLSGRHPKASQPCESLKPSQVSINSIGKLNLSQILGKDYLRIFTTTHSVKITNGDDILNVFVKIFLFKFEHFNS